MKAQSSSEFLIFIIIIFIIALILMGATVFYMKEYVSGKELVALQKEAEIIKNEVYLATTVQGGYTRTFQISSSDFGIDFNITQINNSITLKSRYQQVTTDLGVQVNGTFVKGNNTLRNVNGKVYVN